MPVAFSKPGGAEDRAPGRSRRQQLQRLPAEFDHLADRLRRRLAGRDVVEDIRARLRKIDQLRIDGRFGQIIGLLHDHLGGAAGVLQNLLEGAEEIAAEIVVLVEDADLGVRLHVDDVPGQNTRFGRIERQARHGPFVVLRIVPFRGAGVEQQLRHALGIEIFVHGGLRRGAERAEQRQHFVLLDQPPRRLDAFRRAVGVVHGEELDLAPVDAALLVDHLEIGFADAPQHAIDRAGTGMRHGLAELDFGIAGADIVFFLRRPDERRGQRGSECGGKRGGAEFAPCLFVLHCCSPLKRAMIYIPGVSAIANISIAMHRNREFRATVAPRLKFSMRPRPAPAPGRCPRCARSDLPAGTI